ncbi:MAG: MFS transporter, partial [Bacteroidota bacterium]
DHIRSDGDAAAEAGASVSWKTLLTYRQTWAVAICRFLADPIWYFYLTWLPDFFNSGESLDQKLDLKSIGIPFLIIYLVSDLGSIFFGWLSSRLITGGWAVGRARKFTLLICALSVVPIYFASSTGSIYVAVALISLATAAHQGWSANIYTMGSDLFPKQSVSSVIGIGGMFGAIGGILLAASAGVIRVKFGYTPLFIIAGSSYLIAWLLLNVLVPEWKGVGVQRNK